MNAQLLIERFIYSCSHDIRGPVTSIRGLVNLAQEHPEAVNSENCIEMIGQCAEKLDYMIKSLQEFMTIQQRQLKQERVNVPEVVEASLDTCHDQLVESGIEVDRQFLGKPVWTTDNFSFKLILNKLLDNAIRFSDPLKSVKRIEIKICNTKQESSLLIYDNGIGIPKQFEQKVLDVFFKAHDTSKGAGMGLFLVNHIVSRLMASMQIRSEEGVGTSILIRFPPSG